MGKNLRSNLKPIFNAEDVIIKLQLKNYLPKIWNFHYLDIFKLYYFHNQQLDQKNQNNKMFVIINFREYLLIKNLWLNCQLEKQMYMLLLNFHIKTMKHQKHKKSGKKIILQNRKKNYFVNFKILHKN